MEGETAAVGPGDRDEKGAVVPLEVKHGDRILFDKWSGSEIKFDGEDLLIMNEIGCVIENPSVRQRQEESGVTPIELSRHSNKEQEHVGKRRTFRRRCPHPHDPRC